MRKKSLFINLFCCLFLICSNSILAQFKQKEVYTVYINYPDYTIKANVSNATKKIDVKESLTYHWYASNKILATKGGYDGKILEGLYTSFYLSANLKEKGYFKNGLKDGEWITWNENGKISEICNWKKGLKNGVYKVFSNDTLVSESYYKNDKLNGTLTDYQNGKIVREVKYKNGKEVIKKQKKDNPAPNKDWETTEKKEDQNKVAKNDKHKKSIKERLNSLFSKKEKANDKKQPAEKTKQPSKQDTKRKTSLKEKISLLFKKKENPAKEPAAPVKKNKQEAAAK